MCEPTHSIVQFDDRDDDDNSPGGGSASRIGLVMGSMGNWLKKVGRFLHLSRMGGGHTAAMGNLDGKRETFLLPTHTDYQTLWWERKVTFDGSYKGTLSQQDALQAACGYSNVVSIGSLHAIRSFLKMSITKTNTPRLYVDAFRLMLNAKGKGLFDASLRSIFRNDLNGVLMNNNISLGQQRESLVKQCLGWTRKRHLLVPEWADDKLWLPPSSEGVHGLACTA